MSTTKPDEMLRREREYHRDAEAAVAEIRDSIKRYRQLRATRYQAQADDLLTGADCDEARTALRGYYTDRDEE